MTELHIGNVIRSPEDKSLWIVTEVHDFGPEPTVEVVSFDSENVSGVLRLDDHDRDRMCQCGDTPEQAGEPDGDCEDCHGTGRYIQHVKGWKHSKVLARHVKEFVLKGAKRMWGIT